MEIFLIIFIQGIISGGFCAFIASQKNRDSLGWFFLGFLFSILAILALIAIPKHNDTNQFDVIRICPYCAEQVKEQAIICRFCQKDLPVLNKDLPVLNIDSADRKESVVDLRQQIITLRDDGWSYYLIAEDFNEKNVPIPPELNTKFKIWSPELVKQMFYGMGN
jgi:hypothetical protein